MSDFKIPSFESWDESLGPSIKKAGGGSPLDLFIPFLFVPPVFKLSSKSSI